MPRGRKLSLKQIERAAVDRRNGMSWRELSVKYKCAINTIRTALAAYSSEFAPQPPVRHVTLETQVCAAQTEIENIKKALKKRFNLHV